MSNKPAKNLSERPLPAIGVDRRAIILKLLRKGYTPDQIALHVAKNKGRNYRRIKGQVQRVARESQEFQSEAADQFAGGLVLELPAMGEALAKRAKRGRVDAIRLALEVTGVYNPRVRHEHSGDISISLKMPRPAEVSNQTAGEAAQALEEGNVVDAEVVEE